MDSTEIKHGSHWYAIFKKQIIIKKKKKQCWKHSSNNDGDREPVHPTVAQALKNLFSVVGIVPLLSSGPLTTMCASSSCSWAWRNSSLRLELRSCESTCWAFLLSVVALRRFSAPSLIFSSLRISRRIRSRCSSRRSCTLESEKSEFWSKPSCWSTDNPPGSVWRRGQKDEVEMA